MINYLSSWLLHRLDTSQASSSSQISLLHLRNTYSRKHGFTYETLEYNNWRVVLPILVKRNMHRNSYMVIEKLWEKILLYTFKIRNIS